MRLFLILFAFLFSTHLLQGETVNPVIVTSDTLKINGKKDTRIFFFSGNVSLNSAEMQATCDSISIHSTSSHTEEKHPPLSSFGDIQHIIAKGNVVITEPTRTATAGHAEIIPAEEMMILTENPTIKDKDGIVNGYRIILKQNEQKAIVEGSPDGHRPTVTLTTATPLNIKH